MNSIYANNPLSGWSMEALEEALSHFQSQLRSTIQGAAVALLENPEADLNTAWDTRISREYAQRVRELQAEIASRPILDLAGV